MVKRPAGESDSVENEDSGRTKRLRRDHVLLPLQCKAASNQRQTDHETDCHAHFRRDKIVLERVLHEKRHAEEQRQPADPCEQFCTHKLLPVDGRQRRLWRWQLGRGRLRRRRRWPRCRSSQDLLGNGGGTEAGRTSGDSTIGSETKGSPSAVRFSAANGRSVSGSPGACLNSCSSASRLRNLASNSSTERRARFAFVIATTGTTKQTAMPNNRRKTIVSIN